MYETSLALSNATLSPSQDDVFETPLARTIHRDKYSWNHTETWAGTAHRVVKHVCGDLISSEEKNELEQLIRERKFIPAGRYLYAAGREFHQVNNCHSRETRVLTRGGVFSLEALEGRTIEVLNRFGKWETATVRRFGVQALQRIVFSDGREVLATEGHRWWQEDGSRVTTKSLKEVPVAPPAPVTELDPEAIKHGIVYGDGWVDSRSKAYTVVKLIGAKRELARFFPERVVRRPGRYGELRERLVLAETKTGLMVKFQPLAFKELPAPSCSGAYARGFIAGLVATDGSTKTSTLTISCEGFERAQRIAELAVVGGCRVRRVYVASRVSPFDGSPRELSVIELENQSAPIIRTTQQTSVKSRVTPLQVADISYSGRTEEVFCVVAPESESFTLANGLVDSNCFLFRADDSREGWGDAGSKAYLALMTGGGIGYDYSDVRPYGEIVKRTGGLATGPVSLMRTINEIGREVMQGGSRRSAIWAGLSWRHKDIQTFMKQKNHSEEMKEMKKRDLTFSLPMELTNISTIYDKEFFDEYALGNRLAESVWYTNCLQAFSTAEPGFSINYKNARDSLRNACAEVCSEDDSDKCNLGTLWMQRFKNREEFQRAVKLATLFLLCGGIYSDVPNAKIGEVGSRNNRIGLGLGGIHEWLMARGYDYEVVPEMHDWLRIYRDESDAWAESFAARLGVAMPRGRRAIAPNGTIGIVAETTTSAEPLFCAAYKRMYYEAGQGGGQGSGKWRYQYVIDGSVKRLLAQGIPLELIERNDAYALSFEARVKFQADVQDYVDMAISSTCNMAPWGSEGNHLGNVREKADILMKYAPRLRGFTVYPDGCRGGQPLTKVPVSLAAEREGTVYVEEVRECTNGVCGI